MHQRVRCPKCHHWTDALLVWAASDSCPRCNAPIVLGEPTAADSEARTGERSQWGSDDQPWRRPPRIRQGGRLGERH